MPDPGKTPAQNQSKSAATFGMLRGGIEHPEEVKPTTIPTSSFCIRIACNFLEYIKVPYSESGPWSVKT